MTLPNGSANPDRLFQGQRFIHHEQAQADWHPWRIPGFVHRDTGILEATNGVANVQVAKWHGGQAQSPKSASHAKPATPATHATRATHDCDILFHFVISGTMRLEADGQDPSTLAAGDAFVVPPGTAAAFCECSDDLELMEVALPGAFVTNLHDPV